LSDQLLENVRVQVELPDGFNKVTEVTIPSLPYGQPGIAYTVVKWPEDVEVATAGTINAVLKFVIKDCDPDTGLPDSDEGYDDEYVVSFIFHSSFPSET
jgi:coatomer protein complex subunit gamma